MPAKTFDDYADDLKSLLAACERAVESGTRAKLTAARDSLISFVESSNDLIPGVIELDDVAADARRDISIALLDSGLNVEIGSRSDEVARLVKKFSTQSATNHSAASGLKLERARALTDAAFVAVAELKKFSDLVDESTVDGKKLAKSLQDAIDALADVKNRVGA
jgi:hypothetical protein